ncbi:hypothetical protein B0H14DRAFT_3500251 [Mycena olivaceomarginata]|nr:hypothetical protein B0H14DRAFT_3500251 [Mycena olivaceomarginata]
MIRLSEVIARANCANEITHDGRAHPVLFQVSRSASPSSTSSKARTPRPVISDFDYVFTENGEVPLPAVHHREALNAVWLEEPVPAEVVRPGPVAVHYLFLLALRRTQHVLEAVEHLQIYIMERNVCLMDISKPLEAFQFATFLIRLREDQEALKKLVQKRLDADAADAVAKIARWRKFAQPRLLPAKKKEASVQAQKAGAQGGESTAQADESTAQGKEAPATPPVRHLSPILGSPA